MRTNAWLTARSATLLAAVVVALNVYTGAEAQTTGTLNQYRVLLMRQGEKAVIPAVGGDRWVVRAELSLPADYDPNRKAVEVSVTAPCPECGTSVGGAFPEPQKHINTLHVQQLLPMRGGVWSMKLFDVPDNGLCRALLIPRSTKWVLRTRCRGVGILPPFLDTLEFVLRASIGDDVFTSSVSELKQLKVTVRRYE